MITKGNRVIRVESPSNTRGDSEIEVRGESIQG